MEFILNGQGSGSVAAALVRNNMDPGVLRPFTHDDGSTWCTIQNGTDPSTGKPRFRTVRVNNANSVLTKEAWTELDKVILEAARPSLNLVADIRRAGLVYNIPNGLGKTVFQHQRATDERSATISMDARQRVDTVRPEVDLVSTPLPIIQADFKFGARDLAVSKSGFYPIDTAEAEQAGRSCAEAAEKLFLGNYGQTAFGGGLLYGLTNFPNRITKSMTIPTSMGWTPITTLTEVLQMRQSSVNNFFNGPWKIYNSPNWDIYLDGDYSASGGNNPNTSLRARILQSKGIQSMETLMFLTGYQMIMVQMTNNVMRAVIGMDFTTIQWETMGGLELNFKVMGIIVPQPRADINNRTGIVHGTAA